jgi:hypothetical protein
VYPFLSKPLFVKNSLKQGVFAYNCMFRPRLFWPRRFLVLLDIFAAHFCAGSSRRKPQESGHGSKALLTHTYLQVPHYGQGLCCIASFAGWCLHRKSATTPGFAVEGGAALGSNRPPGMSCTTVARGIAWRQFPHQ